MRSLRFTRAVTVVHAVQRSARQAKATVTEGCNQLLSAAELLQSLDVKGDFPNTERMLSIWYPSFRILKHVKFPAEVNCCLHPQM